MLFFIGFYFVILFLLYRMHYLMEKTFSDWNLKTLLSNSEKMSDWVKAFLVINILSTQSLEKIKKFHFLWRIQIWNLKKFLFASAQSVFSFIWLFLVFLIFFEINSILFFVFLAVIFMIMSFIHYRMRGTQRICLKSAFETLFNLALLVYFLEQLLKLSPVYLPFLEETGIVFFLTNASIVNGLLIFSFIFILGFLLPIQGYAFVLGFVLFLNSQITFINLSFIFAGELMFWNFRLYWEFLRSGKEYFKYTWKLCVILALSPFIFIPLLALIKSEFFFNGVYGDLYSQKIIFLIGFVAVLFCYYLTFMVWGHFNSVLPKAEVLLSDEKLAQEELDSIDSKLLQWTLERLDQRLKNLLQLEQELNDDNRKKIPLFTLKKFDNEKVVLKSLILSFEEKVKRKE